MAAGHLPDEGAVMQYYAKHRTDSFDGLAHTQQGRDLMDSLPQDFAVMEEQPKGRAEHLHQVFDRLDDIHVRA